MSRIMEMAYWRVEELSKRGLTPQDLAIAQEGIPSPDSDAFNKYYEAAAALKEDHLKFDVLTLNAAAEVRREDVARRDQWGLDGESYPWRERVSKMTPEEWEREDQLSRNSLGNFLIDRERERLHDRDLAVPDELHGTWLRTFGTEPPQPVTQEPPTIEEDPLNSLGAKLSKQSGTGRMFSKSKKCAATNKDGTPCGNVVVKNNRCHWH